MSQKLTEWFPANVKPTIPGWYEREYDQKWACDMFDWWDGKAFWLGNGEGAKLCIGSDPRRWRGLEKNPEK